MSITSIFLGFILVLNTLLAIVVIFRERRDASSSWAWLLVLFFIPVLGFILYLLFGHNLSRNHLFQWEDRKRIGMEKILEQQLTKLKNREFEFRNKATADSKDLIYMHILNNHAVFTEDNAVELLTDGRQKFDRLLRDIENAKDHIHLQYYIYKGDEIGKKLRDALIKKAKEGVEVRVLYDELGSRSLRKSFFKELKKSGGFVEVFFPSRFKFINLRMNYRNHRKLVIIDGVIGYVGGFNVGDEYLGLNPAFGYWRDTHLRIKGTAVHSIQTRFILDWNQASHHHDITYMPNHFPDIDSNGNIGMQIVTSGPDSEWEQIKNGYIKMISTAKRSILIQTPYFIPDASLLDALRIACLSGVDVRIMIPNKPDHPFVYWATYSYIGELLKAGASVFIYDNGFIHAKTIVVDEEISSVGTANIDMRSFKLNFEVNAFLYDEEISRSLVLSFEKDLQVSRELTYEEYLNRSKSIRFKEAISILLSPIL
ncbi:cardiolipin synthase [Bacillus sp. FSL W7-1354]|uniref:cardiolipin synthase n=1 Tax=Bacillus TaxID=1386 RepID=UPI0011EBE2EB|nr:cardiolipin synthase [Bacillus paralicheniformis]KAA0835838.1 cardiolipin synthase [Bacillus paralicheniformis]KAA0842601.1 cardiolipin synthase [Bacillus paralicheniformis]